MKRLAAALAFAALFASSAPSRAMGQVPGVVPGKPFTFGGYVKYLANWSIPRSGDDVLDHLLHQRFNLEYRVTDESALVVGMRNRLFFGNSLDTPRFDEVATEDPGFWDLSWNWLNADEALGNTTLDRLYADWRPADFQLRAGRHRIGWGMATLWNPNDLFNAYSTFDFDYEERPGTDALLIGYDLGFASRGEATWAFAHGWDETSLSARYQFNASGCDVQLLTGKNQTDFVVGAGFAGSVDGAGFRGEVSHFRPWWDADRERSTVATLETDYSVSGPRNLIWKAALLYTSNPEDPLNSLIYLNRPLTARTLSFARWTGYGDLSFDVTALSRQTIGVILYDDGSWYSTASNSISVADNWELLLVWQHFDGSSPSLFGTNPLDLLFARVQWSF